MDANQQERSSRIAIDDSVMEIYTSLSGDAGSKEQLPFSTYRDLFLLAACMGFQNGQRKPLSSNKGTTIRLEVFGEEGLAVMKAIAIAHTGDVEVLSNLAEVFTIAEEYAHSGILEVKAYLQDERGLPLWNLVSSMISTH